MNNHPKFGGSLVTVLCSPAIGRKTIEQIKNNIPATSIDKDGDYSQFSTKVMKKSIHLLLFTVFSAFSLGGNSALASTTEVAKVELSAKDIYKTQVSSDWVRGYEVGLENQLETVEGENFVQRNFLRYQATRDKTFPISESNQSVHVEVKGGPMVGHYIGSPANDPDAKYGDKKSIRTGLTGEAVATYNINTKHITPFVGLSADAELMTQPRLEWQTDAVAGVKFNVAKDKDLTLRYQHTLLHKFHYFIDEDETYKQNDGFAVGLIGTKYNKDGTSQSLRLEYERFDKGDITYYENGGGGYEPKTDNWLLSYKKTFK